MRKILLPGMRTGVVQIPSSKSQAHRMLICAALGTEETLLYCDGISADISATIACLRALGADIRELDGALLVRPILEIPKDLCVLPCGESGSTLRFLLPLMGALGANAVFHREGRLPLRPLKPLDRELIAHGMTLQEDGDKLFCSGMLHPGDYCLPGDVSSQYISSLLLALPLLNGESRLRVLPPVESAGYIRMTEEALSRSQIKISKTDDDYWIPGGQRYRLPTSVQVEGDWSNAAFFLCAGALSQRGIQVQGLSSASVQGDRAVLDCLRGFGAQVEEKENSVLVKHDSLRGQMLDASPIPDLIPALSVVAAAAEGETRILHAARLRLKESDRLETTTDMLRSLGASVTELSDGLIIRGGHPLHDGVVDSAGDHRIAMAASVASAICTGSVVIEGAQSVQKSYPRFWQDWEQLEVDAN